MDVFHIRKKERKVTTTASSPENGPQSHVERGGSLPENAERQPHLSTGKNKKKRTECGQLPSREAAASSLLGGRSRVVVTSSSSRRRRFFEERNRRHRFGGKQVDDQ